MKIPYFEVHSFTDVIGKGNPAGVCPLNSWISDSDMQKIAAENNLSETAFFVAEENKFKLRWFTPNGEVDLCGHATLATAFVLFREMGFSKPTIKFKTKSGDLNVALAGNEFVMDFPTNSYKLCSPPEALLTGLGEKPYEVLSGMDYVAVFKTQDQVLKIQPNLEDFKKLDLRGVVMTAPGNDSDYVCRCFAPKYGIDEDPVTGSVQTMLAPYWAEKLGKNLLAVSQLSKRGGNMSVELRGERVYISGKACLYLKGEIYL